MTILFLLTLAALGLIGAGCATPVANLRARTEDLVDTLYVSGSWMDPWLNLVPKETYPDGAGYVRSVFTVGRSEPDIPDLPWKYIQSISQTANGALPASTDYQSARVGHKENTYKPEQLPLVGPLVGQADLVMYWHSKDFWVKYFKALEMHSTRVISNRLASRYMRFVPKMACRASGSWSTADLSLYGPNSSNPNGPDLSGLTGANAPTSMLTQEYLDMGAVALIQESAYDPNTQGWLQMSSEGPIFPLLIGLEASQQVKLNNSEFRTDLNTSYMGAQEVNPVIKRLGASIAIKNFRHIVTPFPPRWALAGDSDTIVLTQDSGGNTLISVAVTVAGALATLAYTDNSYSPANTFTVYQVAANGQTYIRVPEWTNSNYSADVTAGIEPIINPSYIDPAIASVEACVSLHPWVMTQEVIKPINAAPGMKWDPQNYFGEWDFITGNDALLGFAGCTGLADPKHELGRHFALYKAAHRPIFPSYGRLWLYTRCSSSADEVTCS